jgi:MFS family permease
MFLIDNYGRRFLMKVGSVGYIFSLSAIAYAFLSKASGMIVVFFVFLFIASHAIGQGAVIWVFLAEIFPNNVRTKGQSIGSGTHWVLAALIALLMPYFLSRFEPHLIFSFFAFMMILQFLFVVFLMPETKKKSLETISDIFN